VVKITLRDRTTTAILPIIEIKTEVRVFLKLVGLMKTAAIPPMMRRRRVIEGIITT
tara:strand:- start:6216 stop:6383 length:168 start_codon:yes stop_codon:yes gene_type:complete